MRKPKNRCLKCKSWDRKTKICHYTGCDDCKYKLGECDGICNPPECKYGHDADPEKWNPDYDAMRNEYAPDRRNT